MESCRATAAERARMLDGDDLIPDPIFTVDHAITIDAPPEQIWPWLVQMGSSRGGWYSFDRVDNGGRPSADTVLPALQQLAPGDVMPALPGARSSFIVERLTPLRDLVLVVPAEGRVVTSWEHAIVPLDGKRSRLLVRGRVAREWKKLARDARPVGRNPIFIERVYRLLGRLPLPLLALVGGVGHLIMEARHLYGIKRRAEALSRAPSTSR